MATSPASPASLGPGVTYQQLIGWQLGVAGEWLKLVGLLAGLDLHEGSSWGGLCSIFEAKG